MGKMKMQDEERVVHEECSGLTKVPLYTQALGPKYQTI